MMKPTIHTNGTSQGNLLGQVWHAKASVWLAIEALNQAAPNERDYYPQGLDVYRLAMAEHISRVNRLGDVWRELGELAELIADS
jgi:hypothetical protein